MVWLKSPKSQLSKTFCGLKNPLSIKEVMSQNVCVCSFPIFDIFDIHSLTPLMSTLSIFDIFDIALIFCTVFNAFNAMYLNTSNIKQCALTHMNHPTELREKTFRHSQKVSHNFCRKLNLLFRFKLEKYLCIIVAVLPLIAKM